MRTRHKIALGLTALAVLLTLVVWQVSLRFDYVPANTAQTVAFWAISTLVFLLTVLLGFLLFRTAFKLYLERQSLREGSRIKFKLVFGAIALSLLPVAFLVAFSYAVLNRTVEKWFSRPAEGIRINLIDAAVGIGDEVQDRADALANWLVTLPAMQDGTANFAKICLDNRILELRIESKDGELTVCRSEEHTSELQSH